MSEVRAWVADAVRRVEADAGRSADTHLHVLLLPKTPTQALADIEVYLKDESVHPTGSLKHRLARSLFLHALCSGWIGPDTTVVEASSGSTAVSEAYFAQLIGLPFVAVMPARTNHEKVELIELYGGRCHLIDDPTAIYAEAQSVAEQCGGHYLDQFSYAERATDWRGNNNIAETIFEQMAGEPHPVPTWIVVGAGTGGTSATLGRFVRYQRHPTRIAVVDPEGSAFYDGWTQGDPSVLAPGSRIEGVGRPRVEPSFLPAVVDAMLRIPDAASIAAMRWYSKLTGRLVGGSTGTNLWGTLQLVDAMRGADEQGSVVTLICDVGDRYMHTLYDDEWVKGEGLELAPYAETLDRFCNTGTWKEP